MTNIFRAASFAAVLIVATGTIVATDPGFATDVVASAAAPVLQIDAAAVDPQSADITQTPGQADGSIVAERADDASSLVEAAIAGAAEAKAAADAAAAEAGKRTDAAASLAQLVSQIDVPAAVDAETRCLAGAIYFESKGESLAGQLAVGRVVINRAESGRFPSTLCGVVYQRSQFSFVRGGAMPSIPTGSKSWRNALAIAHIAREKLWTSPVKGALFFHATRVSPRWKLQRLATVDNHVFYR